MDKRLSILVLSCDAYSDLWNDFFTLKERYWPDCPFQTYLVTETKQYNRNGVAVLCMGKNLNWSGRLKGALKMIDTPLVLPILDDYFIYKTIDNSIILENVDFCLKHSVSFLSLEKKRIMSDPNRQYYNKYVIIPKHEKYPVDTAAAMWDRDYFIKKLGDGDYSAWQFEVNMCNEAESESGIDGLILCDERTPINITEIPIVIQGKFYPAGVKFFKKLGYTIDISHRDMMSCNLIIKEILKSKMARFPFFRKQLKYIASRFLGYNFFTKD